MNKAEIKTKVKVLKMLNEIMPFKYPNGSTICFGSGSNINSNLVSCIWYDKIGKGFPLQNIIHNPKEWQNITQKEAIEICCMFDKSILLPISCEKDEVIKIKTPIPGLMTMGEEIE